MSSVGRAKSLLIGSTLRLVERKSYKALDTRLTKVYLFVKADAPAVQLAVEAFEQGLGIRPLLTRVGGSIPLMPALTEKGIDTVLTGFGLPESNIHSPNERFYVPYFAAGIDTAAALFTALGRLND